MTSGESAAPGACTGDSPFIPGIDQESIVATLLNIGVSALTSYQRALDTAGHNIANVNTAGYSRQRVELGATLPSLSGAGYIGSGVEVTNITRMYDSFLTTQVRNGASSAAELGVYSDYATRLDDVFADPNLSLAPALQDFFDAVQGLADNPSAASSRQLLFSETQSMLDRLDFLYSHAEDTRQMINRDIESTVQEINALSTAIADINGDIILAKGLSGGNPPNDLMDERDQLIIDLSELVSVTSVPQDNGALNIFIGNGQAMVTDNQAATLGIINNPADINERSVIFTNGSGSLDITAQLAGGRIGGVLEFRDQMLNPVQNQLGRVAAGLAIQFNAQHRLGLDLNGNPGGDYFTAPTAQVLPHTANSGGAVSASFTNVANLTADDYELRKEAGANLYTLTNLTTNATTAIDTGGASPYTTAEIDGFTLTITAGAAAGDSFLVRPTRAAADGIGLAINDLRTIAAAGPLRAREAVTADGVPTNTGTGAIAQPAVSSTTNLPLSGSGGDITLTFNPDAGGAGIPGFDVTGGLTTTLLYDPATESGGKTFTLATKGGASFRMVGVPAAGDSFIITDNTAATGDNRNAAALADLQSAKTLISGTAGFQDAFGQIVSDVGSKTRQMDISYQSHKGLLDQAIAQREAVSGVNLDEEAASLFKYQQAYQAAAQTVNVAKSLFDTLLAAVRR